MKILISTGMFPPDIGGPATYSQFMADRLPQQGIAVDVVSFGQVRHIPKLFRHGVYFLKLIWHGRAADVFFAQDAVSVGLPTIVAGFILGKMVIVRIPGDYAWEQSGRSGVVDSMQEFQKKRYDFKVELLRIVQKFVLNQADRVITPSHAFGEIVRQWVKDPSKVHTIHNGIDSDELKKYRTTTFQPKTLISAGRLVAGKGFAQLIGYMKKLDGWKLEIVGDGPEKVHLENIIKEHGLQDRVTLTGAVPRLELARRIEGSHIFVLNTQFETFSFQIVEALAVGTPVIAPRVGSIPELIVDGQNGILYELNDEAAFVKAVQRISADPQLRKSMSEAGKIKADLFSIVSTVEKVKALLLEMTTSISSFKAKKIRVAKLLRYLFSGGTAAFTDLALLYVFTDVFGMWYVLSSILAFIISFGVSFILQKFFTFQDHGTDGVRGQALVYLLVTSFNLGLNTALVFALVHYAGFHYMFAQILASIIIAVESFVVYGLFIFKPKHQKHS
jgi:glycosyltransferase involved in cell wall biosynthesis/putative flippase GtrA